jgi:hypothetical protein
MNDLRGRVFGRLTVVERAGSNRFKRALWRVLCSCGNEHVVTGQQLLSGHTVSCGCYRASGDARVTHGAKRGGGRTSAYSSWQNMKARCDNPRLPQYPDYGGRGISYAPEWARFENFLHDMGEPSPGMTLDRIDNERGYSKENCRWANRQTQRINQRPYTARARTTDVHYMLVPADAQYRPLRSRPTYRPPPRDISRDLPAGGKILKHGQRGGVLRCGKRPRGYAAWVNMRQRCTNPKLAQWKDYGGRGIGFAPEWNSFDRFLADMGEPAPQMTLDRIDNSKDYGPSNCRWASRAAQALNKRTCVRYELNGKSQTLAEWSRETGIGRVTMLKRIQAGVPLSVALTVKGNLRSTKGWR